jgi:hypothetical protein
MIEPFQHRLLEGTCQAVETPRNGATEKADDIRVRQEKTDRRQQARHEVGLLVSAEHKPAFEDRRRECYVTRSTGHMPLAGERTGDGLGAPRVIEKINPCDAGFCCDCGASYARVSVVLFRSS